jgi:predicted DNA-binding transcriptional regulator AlpA
VTAAAKTRHLTVKDLAERLETTPNAIYILNSRGKGPKRIRTGSRRGLLYRESDVEAWEKTRLVTTSP